MKRISIVIAACMLSGCMEQTLRRDKYRTPELNAYIPTEKEWAALYFQAYGRNGDVERDGYSISYREGPGTNEVVMTIQYRFGNRNKDELNMKLLHEIMTAEHIVKYIREVQTMSKPPRVIVHVESEGMPDIDKLNNSVIGY